jgi:hypothetical protein
MLQLSPSSCVQRVLDEDGSVRDRPKFLIFQGKLSAATEEDTDGGEQCEDKGNTDTLCIWAYDYDLGGIEGADLAGACCGGVQHGNAVEVRRRVDAQRPAGQHDADRSAPNQLSIWQVLTALP